MTATTSTSSASTATVYSNLGATLQNRFCRNANAVKLRLNFDALFEVFSEFVHICYMALMPFHLDGSNLRVQTDFVLLIMHQNLDTVFGTANFFAVSNCCIVDIG